MFEGLRVTPTRRRELVREIRVGSQVRLRFFVLLITASMIASFGLLANSTAVIIGAMLVSPLMTPIFGLALGMLRGNTALVKQAFLSELMGVVLAVLAAVLVGMPQISFLEVTTEMIIRTQPNLIDLLVAVFAGFAGAYALIDPRVSPALPGVAIATAIVPPLSTCGLCLAIGAWSAAGGAILLFLANLVSILVIAFFMFWAAGLANNRTWSIRRVSRHLLPSLVAFGLIAIVLTNALIGIAKDRQLHRGIRGAIDENLASIPGADFEKLVYRNGSKTVQVMVTVRSQHTISPRQVTRIEQTIEEKIDREVDLVIRTILSKDVASIGSSLRAVEPKLDGTLLVQAANDFDARHTLAAQVIREFFEGEPGFEITRVEYGVAEEKRSVVVAYLNSIRRITQNELIELESMLRNRFEESLLRLYLRVNSAPLVSSEGRLLLEWTNVSAAGEKNISKLPEIEKAVIKAIKSSSSWVVRRVHFKWSDTHWKALVEVIGSDAVTPKKIHLIRQSLPPEVRKQVQILIMPRREFVVSEDGYIEYEQMIEPGIPDLTKQLREVFR